VVNLQSGAQIGADPKAALEAIVSALADAGCEATVEPTQPPDVAAAFERAVALAIAGEIDAVVVGGGDGTVSCAASAAAETGVPLGILPLGTLNHFARDCGIPLDLAAAARVLREGRLHRVDVGSMNGRTFVNNSSIGIYPRVVANRDLLRKVHGLRKWPAMLMALVQVLRALSHRRLRVRLAGASGVVRTPCLFVGNNEYGTHIFQLGRRMRLDGGELWLYVVRPVGVLGLLQLAARMALGLLNVERDLVVFKGPNAMIEMKPRRTAVALDGEVVLDETPLRYSIRPKALTIIAP
jgi:diacylglycerol kinase family enzyme